MEAYFFPIFLIFIISLSISILIDHIFGNSFKVSGKIIIFTMLFGLFSLIFSFRGSYNYHFLSSVYYEDGKYGLHRGIFCSNKKLDLVKDGNYIQDKIIEKFDYEDAFILTWELYERDIIKGCY